MATLKYSMLNDDWEVEGERSFVSPLNEQRPGQIIVFSDFMKNGWVSADVTPLEGLKRREGEKSTEAAILFRYGGQDAYYYAGLGAFGAKFFVAKAMTGPFYLLRSWVGTSQAVRHDKTYRIRVEFNGSQITLFENEVQQIVLRDEAYQRGQWGLATWKSRVRFDNVTYSPAQQLAFVVMPFASELKFVYQVIKSTVESFGFHCERADETFISRPVMEEVKKRIAAADLVIVDFTGRNPNVYYEAGLADAWQKDWIVLAQASEDMTFDVRHIGSIRYSNTMCADVKLREDLEKAMKALGHSKLDTAPRPPPAEVRNEIPAAAPEPPAPALSNPVPGRRSKRRS